MNWHHKALVAACFAGLASACGGSPLSPDGVTARCSLSGNVNDDGVIVGDPYLRLAGATVTILSGTLAGKSVTTDTLGHYQLDGFQNCSSGQRVSVRLEARMAGYVTEVGEQQAVCTDGWFGSVSCGGLINYLGQAPHVIKGRIRVAGTGISSNGNTGEMVDGATIEIVGGVNAGRSTQTDSDGMFRLDNLDSSDSFTLRMTKPGFWLTDQYMSPLTKNVLLYMSVSRQ